MKGKKLEEYLPAKRNKLVNTSLVGWPRKLSVYSVDIKETYPIDRFVFER
jgi:hypothetical protein